MISDVQIFRFAWSKLQGVRDCKSEEKEKTLFEEWLGNITHYPRCITTVESNILV